MPQRLLCAAFLFQDQKIILGKVVSQVFRIGIVDFHQPEGGVSSENILPVLDVVHHAGEDFRLVEFLMGGGFHLFSHPLLRILLSVAAHIAEMPAAVGNPDADLLALRKTEFSQLKVLLPLEPIHCFFLIPGNSPA